LVEMCLKSFILETNFQKLLSAGDS